MTTSPSARRPTIRDVAAHAGVSKSLVSLFLSNPLKVSEERRRAVESAIEQLGYLPNRAARSLGERRSRAIGVLVNDISQPWYSDALAGLAGVLHAAGLDLLLADGRMNGATDHSLTRMFLEMDIDGLVLTGSMPVTDHIRRLTASVPTVALGNRDLAEVCTVANDDVRGARLAVEHLLALGHRRIAHLGNSDERVLALRGLTYRQVMDEHALTEQVLLVEAPVSVAGAEQATRALLARPRPPTAIFAVNDLMCLGAYSAAANLGVAVPTGLSLVGYDNTFLADLGMLRLTTVDGAGFNVGAQAGRALNALLAGEQPQPLTLIEPHLVVRASTGPPPG